MTGTLTPITDGTGTLTSIANSTLTLAVENANTTAYPAEVKTDNPVAYWRLEEASGGFEDSSGNANHGSPSVGGLTYGQTGEVGNAVLFDGATGQITVADSTTLDTGDVFTLEAWVNPAALPAGAKTIFDKGAGSYRLEIDVLPFPHFALYKIGVGTPIVKSSAVIAVDGVWRHIVVTKNGSTIAAYQDGVDATSAVANQTIVDTALSLGIGGQAGLFYNGSLDEIAIYPTALTAARVQAHYLASGGGLTLSSRTDNSLVLTPA